VQLIEPRALSKKGDYVKLTLRASSVSDASIDRIWISQPDPAGEPYDPDTDRMEFYGKVTVPANTAMTLSDTLPDVFYGLNQNKRLFIAFDFKWHSSLGYQVRGRVDGCGHSWCLEKRTGMREPKRGARLDQRAQSGCGLESDLILISARSRTSTRPPTLGVRPIYPIFGHHDRFVRIESKNRTATEDGRSALRG
jgi:hypothetical protein